MNRWSLALPVLLLGCSAGAPAPGDSPVETPAQQALAKVIPAAAGETRLAVGEVLEIALEGNASTGHVWEIVEGGAPVLAPQPLPPSAPQVDDADPGPRVVGAPEMNRWHFRAAQAGEATVRLVYRRPWEQDVAPHEAVFRVVVAQEKS